MLNKWEGAWSRHAVYYANGTPGSNWSYGEQFAVIVTGYSVVLTQPPQYSDDFHPNDSPPYNGPTTSISYSPSLTTTQPSLIARVFCCQPYTSGPYAPVYPVGATLNQSYQLAPDMSTADGYMVAIAHEMQSSAGAAGTAGWTMNMGYREDSLALTIAIF